MKYLLFFFVTLTVLNAQAQQQGPPSGSDTSHRKLVRENGRAEAMAMAGTTLLANRDNRSPNLKNRLFNIYYQQRLDVGNAFERYRSGPRLQKKLDSVYFQTDTAVRALLLRTAPLAGNSQFVRAISMRDILQLSQGQVDALTQRATEMKIKSSTFNAKSPLEKFNNKAYESEHLSKILSDIQYTKFLAAKNYPIALKWAQGSWKKIKERGFATDSVTTVKSLIGYNTNLLMLQDKYAHDAAQRSIASAALGNSPPEALRLLKAAERTKAPVADNTTAGQFKW